VNVTGILAVGTVGARFPGPAGGLSPLLGDTLIRFFALARGPARCADGGGDVGADFDVGALRHGESARFR
jgi:hypothetical protein